MEVSKDARRWSRARHICAQGGCVREYSAGKALSRPPGNIADVAAPLKYRELGELLRRTAETRQDGFNRCLGRFSFINARFADANEKGGGLLLRGGSSDTDNQSATILNLCHKQNRSKNER